MANAYHRRQYYLLLLMLVTVIDGIQGGQYRNRRRGFKADKSSLSADKESEFLNKGKICIGTNGRMSVPSNRDHHYRNLKDRYTNCTYVDGNLELTWLSDENLDLSFLHYIREVTGYVLISHVDIRRIVLPRLQIIRGRTLFKMTVKEEEFALLVTLSKMYTLELPALRDVLRGNIGLLNNYNLCHHKSINWKEIITDPFGQYYYSYNFTSPARECPPCHKNCENGCWGEGEENCQKFSKENCSPQCYQGRCFGSNPRECCHLFCAGGCTGPKQSDCIACRNFYDDGVCTQECPPMQIYNPITYSWEKNPKGKYAYGATCVKNCPKHLLKDSGACVRTCPPNKKAKEGACVPCDGPCPKTCRGDTLIHSGNIDNFKGCTIIEGYVQILETSFKGYHYVYPNYTFGERYPAMHPDRLEAFSTLKEITGYINIQAYHPEFKNLSYFRNLEVIGGRTLFDFFTSIHIVKTSLRTLELRSLKRLNAGTVAILENRHLCLADSINWNKIRKSNEHKELMIANNSEAKECREQGLICDEECSKDGCWGSGPDQCLSCAHYHLNGRCLRNCSISPGIYRAGNHECKPCHEECGSFCDGPGPDRCSSCKHFKDGPFCVSQCPTNKYEENGVCQSCHPSCVGGCTGPNNIVGAGGCNSCEKAIMNENATNCLNKNETCPDGYYIEWAQGLDSVQSLAGKSICRKCHPRCKRCTGYGFHQQICQECTHYKKGEQCEDECSQDDYADETLRECLPCDPECKGCTGPGANNTCISCQNFRVYEDGDGLSTNSSFICVAHCPKEFPIKHFPENADTYCSDQAISSMATLTAYPETTIAVVGGVFAIAVILILSVLYVVRKRAKEKENTIKMTMALTCLEDEPLRPNSNVKPNIAQLRIVKETAIRRGNQLGFGAFGTVYKGVWIYEGGNSVNKIPIAIKVLRESTGMNSSKEFLDEAYIMASVDHPHLLKLLAVCMTSELMLITQLMPLGCLLDFVRKNHNKLGEKPLLNWCKQIARGMAYLEEKRLVHRDLAARNVLVQTPNCVKITDFGLAKLLDINEEEYKAEGGKMPIKWLALECIQHRRFTHKSDVWAFGVTVWELLTFGGRPYDNVPARDVPELIEKGDRLPQPPIATIEVYMIIIKCWMLDADSRPSFKELADDFAKMAKDPWRYLIIDRTPMQNFSVQDGEVVRSLPPPLESLESQSEGNEYFQPKSRAPLHAPNLASMSPLPPSDKYWRSASQVTSDGSSQYQNNINQQLLKYSQGHNKMDSQSDGSSVKTCGDSLKIRDDSGADEYDSGRSQATVGGNLKLELPVDEDDYLMPSPQRSQAASTYVDLIDSNSGGSANVYNYASHIDNQIDNPEYLMNNDAPSQTVGLPTVSELVQHQQQQQQQHQQQPYHPQRSSEEESDHEYYNDFDSNQRELQPLQKNKDGSIV